MQTSTIDQAAKEKIIKTIQRLLAKADPTRNSSEAEVEVCSKKVSELLLKHKLDIMDVHAHYEEGESVGGKVTHGHVRMGVGRVSNFAWCRSLGGAIASVTFTHRLWQAKKRELIFVGTDMDVKAATELYVYLSTEMKGLCKASMRAKGIRAATSEGNKYFNDFMYGASVKLWQNLAKWHEDQIREAGVLVRIVDEANRAYAAKMAKYTYKEPNKETTDATMDGYKDADKIALKDPRKAQLNA